MIQQCVVYFHLTDYLFLVVKLDGSNKKRAEEAHLSTVIWD
jgi:hypothetical protein